MPFEPPARLRGVARAVLLLLFVGSMAAAACAHATPNISDPEIAFEADRGSQRNRFVRKGPVAAQVALRSGLNPRLLIAFPAGDSGVAVWFGARAAPVVWEISSPPRPVSSIDVQGRPLRGIEVGIAATSMELSIDTVVLGSIRTIRDFESSRQVPSGVSVEPHRAAGHLEWSRDRIDGRPGYRLSIQVLPAARVHDNKISGSLGRIELRILAMTGETPLTPLPATMSLTSQAVGTPLTRDVFAFLSYREKFLAGSWRFDTYFGRDTLMTLALLRAVLTPEALAYGFRSVLSRCSRTGEVAHEESIGEYAVLLSRDRNGSLSDVPQYDYTMVDESFMLAPAIEQWLLSRSTTRSSAEAFLAQRGKGPDRMGDLLVRNLLWIVRRTAAFATRPVVANMVGLKSGTSAGDWRDSPDGLGGGRYPYDVNVVLVPAALRATRALIESGVMDPYLSGSDRGVLEMARAQYSVWQSRAALNFIIKKPSTQIQANIRAYAASVGVDPGPALRSLAPGPLEFEALALDEEGRPVPVMHSDGGFALLFDDPDPDRLAKVAGTVTRPFPAGLWTPVGMVVANPAFAAAPIQRRFNRTAYHGTVIWSWQNAMLAAGLQRQLAREDLPTSTRALLLSAQQRLWSSIRATASLQSSELWSWSFAAGAYHPAPYAQRADESNAAQLWSTAFLALAEPHPQVP